FLPLLKNSIDVVQDTLEKRNIYINYDSARLARVQINANGWLIQNSVLSNVLSHALIHAKSNSTINIVKDGSDEANLISFHIPNTIPGDVNNNNGLTFERRMEVARRILRIYQGELILQRDMNEGMIIRLSFPQY